MTELIPIVITFGIVAVVGIYFAFNEGKARK